MSQKHTESRLPTAERPDLSSCQSERLNLRHLWAERAPREREKHNLDMAHGDHVEVPYMQSGNDITLVQYVHAMAFSNVSRRSPVLCRDGCVACSQPLAAEAGLSVLKKGGNAADAAVAVAAALNVTEPCSTGIGGDCFCLFYEADSKKVRGLNGRYAISSS